MKGSRISTALVMAVFCITLIVPYGYRGSASDVRSIPQTHVIGENLPYNATHIQRANDSISVSVYDPYLTLEEGLNLFAVQYTDAANGTIPQFGVVFVLDMWGNIVNLFYREGYGFRSPVWMNSSTVLLSMVDVTDQFIAWNIYTNDTEVIPIPSVGEYVQYNPVSDTFAVIESVSFGNYADENLTIIGNDVVEYDREGNEIWRWEGNLTLPFNATEYHLRNETISGTPNMADWMHATDLYWDMAGDAMYLNVRNLDCLVKIDHDTGQSLWILGGYRNQLNITDSNGIQVDRLFYHASSCEAIGNSHFIVFDNDMYNLTRPNPQTGRSRYLEFSVDELDLTAKTEWVWEAPENYFAPTDGNAVRLRNPVHQTLVNTLGVFDTGNRIIMTEVSITGSIVWELVINDLAGYRASVSRVERFYYEPIVGVVSFRDIIIEGSDAEIGLVLCDVIQKTAFTTGRVIVSENEEIIYDIPLTIEPYGLITTHNVHIPGLELGQHDLTLIVMNSDGHGIIADLRLRVETNGLQFVLYGEIVLIGLIVIVYLWQKRSPA
jgi:hypothetical protein